MRDKRPHETGGEDVVASLADVAFGMARIGGFGRQQGTPMAALAAAETMVEILLVQWNQISAEFLIIKTCPGKLQIGFGFVIQLHRGISTRIWWMMTAGRIMVIRDKE